MGVIVGITNGVEVACGAGVFAGVREKPDPPRNTNQPVNIKTRQAATANPPRIPS